MDILQVLILVAALCVLFTAIMKGINIYLAAIASSLVVLVLSGMDPVTGLIDTYMTGFANFMKGYFLLFLLGTAFGKLMSATGCAKAIAELVVKLFGRKWAVIGLPVACGLLSYGGISGYVLIFTVFPIIVSIWEELDMPRYLAAAVIQFGSGTWANFGLGSPALMNVVCCTTMGVSLAASPIVGIAGMAFSLVVGSIWFMKICNKAKAKGEHWEYGDMQKPPDEEGRVTPNGWMALLPVVVTVFCINFKYNGNKLVPSTEVGILIGCIAALVLFFKYLNIKELPSIMGEAARDSLGMIGTVCAVCGFGAVVTAAPAFEILSNLLMHIPGPPVIGLCLAVNVLAACTGSATSAVSTVLPTLGPVFSSMGMDPGFVARMAAISATGCDSVPSNGAVIGVFSIFRVSHKQAYPTVFKLTVLTPILATIFAGIVGTLIGL